jgi:homoserine dehydrogenase
MCANAEPLAVPFRRAHPSVSQGPAPRSLAIGLIGPGQVGQAFLRQVRAAQGTLRRTRGVDLHMVAALGRQRMWWDVDDAQWQAAPDRTQVWRPSDPVAFLDHVQASGSQAVLVDCSASDAVPDQYAHWLHRGIHVVTPNKRAGSGPLHRWEAIQAASRHGGHFRYEATVGAGLPVVQTLRDLLDTGDDLHTIEGMLSGTLAWLCYHHDGSHPFSEWVRQAHTLGYTEPDPRDDLSGMDVARKLVILAREAGWALSLNDVQVESLVPSELANVEKEMFFKRLPELDAAMADRLAQADAQGGVLRHVASLDPQGRARVRLQVVPADHAFAHSRQTDNVVQFTTRRYADNPLVIQGPGAGADVTAAGIFADVLRLVDRPSPMA